MEMLIIFTIASLLMLGNVIADATGAATGELLMYRDEDASPIPITSTTTPLLDVHTGTVAYLNIHKIMPHPYTYPTGPQVLMSFQNPTAKLGTVTRESGSAAHGKNHCVTHPASSTIAGSSSASNFVKDQGDDQAIIDDGIASISTLPQLVTTVAPRHIPPRVVSLFQVSTPLSLYGRTTYQITDTMRTHSALKHSIIGTVIREEASPPHTPISLGSLPWVSPRRPDNQGYNYRDLSRGATNGHGQVFHEGFTAVTLTTIFTVVETVTVTLVSHTPAESVYTGLVSIWSMTIAEEVDSSIVVSTNNNVTHTVEVPVTVTDGSSTSGMPPSDASSALTGISTSDYTAGNPSDPSIISIVSSTSSTDHRGVSASKTATSFAPSQPTPTKSTAGVAPTTVQKAIGMLAGMAGAVAMVF